MFCVFHCSFCLYNCRSRCLHACYCRMNASVGFHNLYYCSTKKRRRKFYSLFLPESVFSFLYTILYRTEYEPRINILTKTVRIETLHICGFIHLNRFDVIFFCMNEIASSMLSLFAEVSS